MKSAQHPAEKARERKHKDPPVHAPRIPPHHHLKAAKRRIAELELVVEQERKAQRALIRLLQAPRLVVAVVMEPVDGVTTLILDLRAVDEEGNTGPKEKVIIAPEVFTAMSKAKLGLPYRKFFGLRRFQTYESVDGGISMAI